MSILIHPSMLYQVMFSNNRSHVMLFYRNFFIGLLVVYGLSFAQNTTYILIHGTWSSHASWYQEGGDFYDTLYSAIDESDEIVSFSWSGDLSEIAREKAAELLVSLLESREYTEIVLVGHSHGGNVAVMVARLLQQKNQKRIAAIIFLGTPQYYRFEIPQNVDFLFNLFSFGDMTQPVFNVFKREIPESEKTANLAVLLEGREPDHHRLYHPVIGFYLPRLLRLYKDDLRSISDNPHSICFSFGSGIQFIPDNNRKTRINTDLLRQEQLLSYLLWGPAEHLYFYP